jgi:hypothetical protein
MPVPYIRAQLEHLDLLVDDDEGTVPHDPIAIHGTMISRSTPFWAPFDGDAHSRNPWQPSTDNSFLVIPPEEAIPPSGRDASDVSLSTVTTMASTLTSSSYSTSVEREQSKDRMTNIKISPLPTSGEALREWVLNLKWTLTGDCWCHDGVHATDILTTTAPTKSLPNDLLSILKKAVTEHTNSSYQRNARSLLQDNLNGVDGMSLIAQGKGLKLYHTRIKSGFSRGLGTEAITHLNEYVSVYQKSLESVGSYFGRMAQLYAQVQQTKGCAIGDTAQKSFALEGLRRGAYHEVLGPWVKKILIGQGRIKLDSATVANFQHGVTDLLATSSFHRQNILLAGRLPKDASARLATDVPSGSTSPDNVPSTDPILEGIVTQLRKGFGLSKTQTAWMRTQFKCFHCCSHNHTPDHCRGIQEKYYIGERTGAVPGQGGSRPAGRQAIVKADPKLSSNAAPTFRQVDQAPKAKAATAATEPPGEESNSVADESNESFTFYGYESDPGLLSTMEQTNSRQAEDARRVQFMQNDSPPATVARRTTTMAKIGKNGKKWVDQRSGTGKMKWNDREKDDWAKKANIAPCYPTRVQSSIACSSTFDRTLCPDSGATSIMGPHRDMIINYVDLRGHERVVRLGDENKTIPIYGGGTLCINVLGHALAYANALHVPDLSAILLSTRVHRRVTQGCSFLADHDGCFLTYPNFTVEIEDTDDCVIPCSKLPLGTPLDFDARLHLSAHSSQQEARRCFELQLDHLH